MSNANYWTTMVALFVGIPMAGAILAVGLFLATVIRGKREKVLRNDDLLIVERDRAA